MPPRIFTLLVFTLSLALGAIDTPIFEEYDTALRTLNKNRATISDSPLIFVGSSGVVIHTFEDDKSTIIAKAVVLAKDGVSALVELTPYDALTQNTFPKAVIVPKSGDKIKLNYLYDRSLLVVPNSDSYKKITETFTAIAWVHPDLAAAYLAKKYTPAPTQKTFGELCNINLTGLITFHIGAKGYFVDCASFKVLRTFNLPASIADKASEAVTPFYSRISDSIQNSPLIIIGGAKIGDYASYYKDMIGIK